NSSRIQERRVIASSQWLMDRPLPSHGQKSSGCLFANRTNGKVGAPGEAPIPLHGNAGRTFTALQRFFSWLPKSFTSLPGARASRNRTVWSDGPALNGKTVKTSGQKMVRMGDCLRPSVPGPAILLAVYFFPELGRGFPVNALQSLEGAQEFLAVGPVVEF